MKTLGKLEAILWSIALPGFTQLLIGSWIKGVLFVLLEFIINVQSHFNKAIMLSFLGETRMAAEIIDYQWLMFYPCLYMFAMWDAYKASLVKDEKLSFLPFVFSAYTVTVGLMVSPNVEIMNVFIGPIFFPMMCVVPGVIIGFILKKIILHVQRS
ncbi:hypothetical protein JOC86_003144 [Bacillus pakistanensis]|uniref:Uncharacterized protein n=1 Tax=Rossellomorea pakistanensis TaxID=992288 RepID=A0ABS2NFE9_9BACI|nr:hypothetical protein [Bacillus pakistanensis]MBM7586592.1 hypothetical protein [Bacillus pakistanensis]